MPWFPPSLFWLAAALVLLALEAVSVGLTSIWFALGALAALIASFFTGSVWVQCGLFLAVSLVSLLALRPVLRRFVTPRRQATNADRVIGREGIVTLAVDNLKAEGQVQVDGAVWSARSASGAPIPAQTAVRVERIEGVKLIVTPVSGPAGDTEKEE